MDNVRREVSGTFRTKEGNIWRTRLVRVGFEVLTAVRTKMTVFWVVALCSLVEVCQRFRGPCCLHHQGSKDIWNAGKLLPNYTALQPRRQQSSINELETKLRTKILETSTEAEINLRRVTKLQLSKIYEWWSACRFPQFSEQMKKLLRSAVECT
jgi:hypothetical protein